ncbi:MAG: glycosyltransferase family 39 protein [Methanobrevibacter sp.]|nr:glycosyltransferase family 39 protein [Methanobrevibacter sp.]
MESLKVNISPYLPPFIPFLSSLFFRIGIYQTWAIMLISTIFFFFSIIGFYLLLNLRFSKRNSFIFSILFMLTPIVFSWASRGNVDIPLLCLIIWSMYVLIRGFEKNSSFLYLLFPLLALGFLTKYVFGLILIPISFYFIINIIEGKLDYIKIKKIVIGLFFGILILVPYFYISMNLFGKILPFLSQVNEVMGGTGIKTEAYDFNGSKLFYVKNIVYILNSSIKLNNIINTESIAYFTLILASLIGLIGYVKNIIKKTYDNRLKTKIKYILFFIMFISLLSVFYFKFTIISIVFAYLLFLILYGITKKHSNLFIKMDITLLLLGITFLIFFSLFDIKSIRYILPVIPVLYFFILVGMENLYLIGKILIKRLNKLKPQETQVKFLKKYKIIFGICLILLISISVFPSLPQYINFTDDKIFEKNFETDLVYNWFIKNVKNPKDEKIYVNNQSSVAVYNWYLKQPVYLIKKPPKNRSKTISKELLEQNATVYIHMGRSSYNIPGYEKSRLTKQITIYKRA